MMYTSDYNNTDTHTRLNPCWPTPSLLTSLHTLSIHTIHALLFVTLIVNKNETFYYEVNLNNVQMNSIIDKLCMIETLLL